MNLNVYKNGAIIHSKEHQHFSIIFNQMTTQLMEWYANHEKNCGHVIFNLHIDEALKPQADKMISNLLDNDSPYRFLKKVKFETHFLSL